MTTYGAALTSTKDFADVCRWIEDRYPGTRNFRNAASLYPDFAFLHPNDIREAAKILHRQGRRTAPTASELLHEANDLALQKRGAGLLEQDPRQSCANGHRYGIVGEIREDGVEIPYAEAYTRERIGQCCRCREIRRFPAGQLLTRDEIDTREELRRKYGEGPRPDYDRSDRIAP